MLIHITPRIRRPPMPGVRLECSLVDLTVAELGLSLKGGTDLVTRKPYPNKHFFVACRRGRRATAGFFIEAAKPPRQFTAVARWSLDSEVLVTHRVRYEILDDEFDAVTDDMTRWYAWGSLGSRWPAWAKDQAPSRAQPCMDVLRCHSNRVGQVVDVTTRSGLIEERTEVFPMPTVERHRLVPAASGVEVPGLKETPLPLIETAVKVATP